MKCTKRSNKKIKNAPLAAGDSVMVDDTKTECKKTLLYSSLLLVSKNVLQWEKERAAFVIF